MSLDTKKLSKLHKRYPLKRAAITGAGAGLGEALAVELAHHGWTLWLNDLDEYRLNDVSSRCIDLGATVVRANFNVADYESFARNAETFLSEHGGVDLVFTSAGIGVGGAFVDTPIEHLREVVDVNLLGTMWAGKVFIPNMIQSGAGHFITIASAAAYHGMPNLSGYAATKAGVVQLSETLRSELRPHGVDVTTKMTTFYTSSIAEHTRGTDEEREKARSLLEMAPWSAAEVADALLLAVQKRQFYMVAPGQARFLWRFKRFFPERYLRLMPTMYSKLEAKLLSKSASRKSGSKQGDTDNFIT